MDDFGHDRRSSQFWMFRQCSDFPFYKKQHAQLSGTVSEEILAVEIYHEDGFQLI